MIWDIDLIFGMRVYNYKLQFNFEIHSGWMMFGLLPRELKKGETFASLLNIHGGDIRVVPTHLVLYSDILSFDIHFINLFVD